MFSKRMNVISLILIASITTAIGWNLHHHGLALFRDMIAGLTVFKFCQTTYLVFVGDLKATRLALPALASLSILLTFTPLTHEVGRFVLGFIELTLLAVIVGTLGSARNVSTFKDKLESRLELVLPRKLASLAATELYLFTLALQAPMLVIRGTVASATSYVEQSKLKVIVLALPFLLLPEVFVDHFIFWRSGHWVPVVLDILTFYVMLLLWGTYTSMVRCEHIVSKAEIILRHGITKRVVVAPMSIRKVDAGTSSRKPDGNGKDAVADLSVKGVPSVRLYLDCASEFESFGHQTRLVSEVIVPSDRPSEFANLVREHLIR